MSKKLASLTYTFVFDPAEVSITRRDQMDSELADFFLARNLEASYGEGDKCIVFLSPVTKLSPPALPLETSPVKTTLDGLRNNEPQNAVRNFNKFKK